MSSYESAKKLQQRMPYWYKGMVDDVDITPRAKKYWQIDDIVENEAPEQRDEWENETVRVWMGKELGWVDMIKNAYKIRYRSSEEEKKLRLRKIADLYNEWLYNNSRDNKKKVLSEFKSFVDEAKYEPYSEDQPLVSFYGENVKEAERRWKINAEKMDSSKKKKKGGKTKTKKRRKGRTKKK